MRYLHPVQAHETFVASGRYHFYKDAQELDKTETWVIHQHLDGGRMTRVDVDARCDDGKSILAEALENDQGELERLDIRYENARFEGGIRDLRVSYQLNGTLLQVGYNLNGAQRQYAETELPPDTLIDIPLLIFRGRTIQSMARLDGEARQIYVPMYEHAQLFPGTLKSVNLSLDSAGEDTLALGKRQTPARRYRYRDKAVAYWIDRHGVVIKRVNAFKQHEFVVTIRNYAAPSR